LSKNQGILKAPPDPEKTVIGVETVLKRSQRSLILVHTKDLLRQWCDRFEQFTDERPGTIDADRYDLRDITIAMVQSLRKPLDASFLNRWGFVFLDEAIIAQLTLSTTLEFVSRKISLRRNGDSFQKR